jgi:tetratricopeptide (TPR) repeat protein
LRSEATNTFLAGNGTALRALATTTTAWWQSTNRDEVYSAAFVQFRLAQLASSADDKAALKAAGERCVALANAAIKIDPNFTVGHAVLSACYGYLANLGGFAAIGNGRNSGKAMAAAMKLDALNPQAVLVDAVSLRFRPRIAGGDKQKAYLRAQEAAQLFAASPADWGAAEAHYWVGRGAAEAGDSAKARAAYERALALAPEFAAARKALAATK